MYYKIFTIILLFIITFDQLKHKKGLLIPTRKSPLEVIAIIIGFCMLIYVSYFYAHTYIDYLIMILGLAFFEFICTNTGITEEGFRSNYRCKPVILWDEIEDVDIKKTKHLKITVLGKFVEQSFDFKLEDYDRVVETLKKNLYKKHNS